MSMKLSTRVSNPAVPLCASMVRLSTGLPWMQRTMASSVMESGPQGNALTSTMPSTRWCSCVMAPMISRFTIHGSVSEKSKLACSERSRSVSYTHLYVYKRQVLDHPDPDDDILSVCDRLLTSLDAAERNAFEMIELLERMKKLA